jgi:hypothetical protein
MSDSKRSGGHKRKRDDYESSSSSARGAGAPKEKTDYHTIGNKIKRQEIYHKQKTERRQEKKQAKIKEQKQAEALGIEVNRNTHFTVCLTLWALTGSCRAACSLPRRSRKRWTTQERWTRPW